MAIESIAATTRPGNNAQRSTLLRQDFLLRCLLRWKLRRAREATAWRDGSAGKSPLPEFIRRGGCHGRFA